ncbi:ATPase, partial [Candidatus Bathyarchaeota archaeon]|nr:ATPase [Candidatus Bathyarchaeota archaeon]
MKRVPLGIRGFDELIQGGLPVGVSVLLVGEPMTGKTTLAMQFLYNGLTLGDVGIFITTNATAEDVKERMASYGWDTT